MPLADTLKDWDPLHGSPSPLAARVPVGGIGRARVALRPIYRETVEVSQDGLTAEVQVGDPTPTTGTTPTDETDDDETIWWVGGAVAVVAVLGIGIAIATSNPKPKKRRNPKRGFKRCPVGTEVQTLIISRNRYAGAAGAKRWAKRHGFRHGKVDSNARSHRIRQRNPEHFKKGTFRTITLTDGVRAVIGCPR